MNERKHIVILGATGRVGSELVRLALYAGYLVTAIVRSPEKVALKNEALVVLKGDIADPAGLTSAFDMLMEMDRGPDAVLSTLGIFQREPGTPLADGTRTLIQEIKRCGIDRFVVMSSLGVGDSAGQGNWLVRLLTRTRLKFVMIDKNAQEAAIKASGLTWSILRPPQIVKGPVKRPYLQWEGDECVGRPRWKITAATAAQAMLDCLSDPSAERKARQISS